MSGLQKNTASQRWIVFAFDRTDNTPKTGDAGNITANLRIDGGDADAVDDTNPTELEDGYYYFDVTQAETNGDMLLIAPVSVTADIQVIGVPGVMMTTAPNSNALGIESDGSISAIEDHNTVIDVSLLNFHLDKLFVADYDPASKPGVATALLNELIESDSGVSRLTANALEQGPVADVSGLATTGADGDTLETLSDQLDGVTGALGGEGAYTGTLTVDDGSTGLQGAVVHARRGGILKASGTTDSNGEITDWVFGAYTYDLAVRLAGYQPETDTIAVIADAWTKTISLTSITISAPPNASTTTGVMTVYDEQGSVEESVEVSVQITDGPGTDGIGYDSAVWTETSSAQGVVEFAGIILGARYKIWRGDSRANVQTFTAPTSGDSFDLAEVIGRG